ncbi:MAG TPA: helix-turn-helix domain-containing protein [Candidatus Sulfotelmatobacter sp.]|nr:helix-turn-helix domain-containing protein [Candidatus Sulfotelmatobacter sp.]
MSASSSPRAITAAASLSDPTRRQLYEYVSAQGHEVSRDEAASAVGIPRSVAAFHLDRLVRDGALRANYRRLSGRTGPGAGRSSKLYSRIDGELGMSLPPRRYELAGELLAAALSGGAEPGRQALCQAAHDLGESMGHDAPTVRRDKRNAGRERVLELLRLEGFEPFVDDGQVIRLRNCPFHAIAKRYPDVVCEMNLELVKGMMDGLGEPDVEAVIERQPGMCCVALSKGPNGRPR